MRLPSGPAGIRTTTGSLSALARPTPYQLSHRVASQWWGTRGRSLRRYRLVIAQKSKLRLTPEVLAALASQGRDHRLTASGFFPCSIDREYLYGYTADGYRSPLWLCASHNGNPVLVHRQRGTKIFFHQALEDRKLLALPGIHHFEAHRLRAHLLQASELQLNPRTSNIRGRSEDPSSEEERDTTDAETDAEATLVSAYPGHAR